MTNKEREAEESISLLGNQHTQYPTDYDPSRAGDLRSTSTRATTTS